MHQYQVTTATTKLSRLNKRIKGVAGGTGASKTISILLLWIDRYQTNHGLLGSIVSESRPHLSRGAERDFINILKAHDYYDVNAHNKTNHTYMFETGSMIEFFPADDDTKLRGGRRNDLFINEANNVSFNSYNELEVRTSDNIWLDWNPVNSYWWYEEILPHHDVDFITLTYKDNEALPEQVVASIESRKHTNPEWYRVYGLGELGKLEGVIFHNWQLLDEVPPEARLERRGLDFGFTNDPSALVDIYKYNNAYIIDEQLYATGMLNRQIADIINSLGNSDVPVVADSAEPKSIADLKEYGVNAVPSEKGQDSVRQGIQVVQDQKLYVTKRSLNVIKDLRNYSWKTDRMGKPLNVPDHEFSHAPDAIRYGITHIEGKHILTADDIVI